MFLYIVVIILFSICAVEQQSQLLSAGGLPVIITLLTETSDEELKKAAIFVLHTCNRISEFQFFLYSHKVRLNGCSSMLKIKSIRINIKITAKLLQSLFLNTNKCQANASLRAGIHYATSLQFPWRQLAARKDNMRFKAKPHNTCAHTMRSSLIA